MSRLASSLSESSVFKNFVKGKHPALAIKEDSQVFVAFENVIKVANIYGQTVPRILNFDSAKFIVNQIILNRDSSLLASVGSRSICVYDVKSKQEPSGNLMCSRLFASLPPTSSPIKSVLWHPASRSGSELVILTQDNILLYDLVMSKTVPVLTIDFKQYPELKSTGVSSMAFGSSVHFAGTITLYLSTNSGEIYAIYPFLYLGSKVWATKAAASRFVSEWDATMDSIDGLLPDSCDFEEARHPLNRQATFVGGVRQQLEASLCSEALGAQAFSWVPNFQVIDYKLSGPLAFTGRNARILQVSSNERFPSLVVAFEGESGNTAIKTFAQINPIVLSFNTASLEQPLPEAPAPSSEIENVVYKKIRKGFGYEEVPDTNSQNRLSNYKAQMKIYKEKLFAHKIKTAYYQFACKNFNKLTLLTNDSIQFPYDESIANSLKLIEKSIFVLNNCDKLLIGDASCMTQEFRFGSPMNLEIHYKQKNLLKHSTKGRYDFAYIDDVIEGTGGYIVTLFPSSAVSVIQLRPNPPQIEPLVIMPKQPETKEEMIPADMGPLNADALPSDDLRMIYTGIDTRTHPTKINFSGDYFKPTFDLTSGLIGKLGKFTQYFVAVHIKLGLQIENFKSQIQIFEGLPIPQGDAGVNVEERISKVSKRQELLIKRLEGLRMSIIEKFEETKSKQSIPLSEEERNWFHELNAITKKITVGDGQTPSLESSVDKLKEKVRKVSTRDKTQDEDEAIEESLSKLRLGVSLYNINNTLERESKRVKEIKDTIEGLIVKVHDAGLST